MTEQQTGTGAPSRQIAVEQKVLSKNDEAAAANRSWLRARGITALNLISSPGAGKTLLLERTLEQLIGVAKCAVIVGDQQTDNDARRLSGKGAEVRQIETGNTCHLDALRVKEHLAAVCLPGTRLLFIENVGNLICPAAFDLGEDFKVALLSVTEGEDKPIKYPRIFSQVKAVVLTKTDLVPHLDWDGEKCLANLQRICPAAAVFELSAKTGEGLTDWIDYLRRLAGRAGE